MTEKERKTIHRRIKNGFQMPFKEIFHLISNQRKQPEGINERFIYQTNKVYDKGDSTLVRMLHSYATDKFKLLETAERQFVNWLQTPQN